MGRHNSQLKWINLWLINKSILYSTFSPIPNPSSKFKNLITNNFIYILLLLLLLFLFLFYFFVLLVDNDIYIFFIYLIWIFQHIKLKLRVK